MFIFNELREFKQNVSYPLLAEWIATLPGLLGGHKQVRNVMSSIEDDIQLLGAWHNHRDAESFRILCERYAGLIEGCCRRHGSPDPTEAVQAVFLVLARRAGSVSATSLGGWLTTTAKRVVKDQHRAEGRRRRHEQEAAMVISRQQAAEDSHTTWAEARQHLDEALASLSSGRREAILRFYLAGRPQAEVAAELGCSVAAIKMRVHEGLERMRVFYARKGIALGVVALGSGLASEATGCDPTLITTCVQTVQTPAAAPGAAALAKGIVTTMIIKNTTLAAVGLILAGSCLTAALVVGAKSASTPAAVTASLSDLKFVAGAESAMKIAVVTASPPNLKKDGLFGFPQNKATVVCDTKDLRVSVWNDAVYLYVQAVIWGDGDDSLGESANDGRKIGDRSSLLLDVDVDGKTTPNVDRNYMLNPWPDRSGLGYEVMLGDGASTGIRTDSKGRGVIHYAQTATGKVRVDSYLIPIIEIGRKPGDHIRFDYDAWSPKPVLFLNSLGSVEKHHDYLLIDRPATLDATIVPDGREEQKRLPKKMIKPMPNVGDTPPEVVAKDWLNTNTTPTLAGLKGKVVVVYISRTSIERRDEGYGIPQLNKLHEDYASKGLVILSLTEQGKTGIQNLMKNERLSMKYILGTGSEMGEEYGVNVNPHAFIIDKDGKLVWHGDRHEEDFERQIAQALNGK